MEKIVIKQKKEEDLVKHLLYRRISRFFTPIFYRLRTNPDTLSLMMIMLAILTLFVGNKFFIFLIIQLMLVCDCIDGELARLYKRKGKLGMWMDASAGFLSFIFVMICMSLVFYDAVLPILVILGFSLFAFFLSEIKKLYMKKKKREVVLSKKFHFGGTSLWFLISLTFLMPNILAYFYLASISLLLMTFVLLTYNDQYERLKKNE